MNETPTNVNSSFKFILLMLLGNSFIHITIVNLSRKTKTKQKVLFCKGFCFVFLVKSKIVIKRKVVNFHCVFKLFYILTNNLSLRKIFNLVCVDFK